jgi:hypothetical protein
MELVPDRLQHQPQLLNLSFYARIPSPIPYFSAGLIAGWIGFEIASHSTHCQSRTLKNPSHFSNLPPLPDP